METALDQITKAGKLLGVIAEDETPSSSEAQDSLEFLNQMIDAWSLEGLMVFAIQNQQFTWPANEASQTLGPSGDFIGNRPLNLDKSTYFVDTTSSDSFAIRIIGYDSYNTISLKTETSTYPTYIWPNYTAPNATLTVYPVPTLALEWHFVSAVELTQPATLATELVFPPGYLRAFSYNLAQEISSVWGVMPSPHVTKIASSSKRIIKRSNLRLENILLNIDSDLPSGQDYENIISGDSY